MMLNFAYLGSFNTQSSVASVIWLVALALNFWAVTRIIRQAGYSSVWIVVPLVPLVLSVWTFFIPPGGWNSLLLGIALSFLGGAGLLGTVLRIDELSIIICWLCFIAFSFSRWPVSEGRAPSKKVSFGRASVSEPKMPRAPAPAPDSGAPLAPPTVAAPQVASARGASASGSAGANSRKFLYCGWCGEATPGNRALTHNCGDEQRPLAFCRVCGKPFTPGSTSCANCDA